MGQNNTHDPLPQARGKSTDRKHQGTRGSAGGGNSEGTWTGGKAERVTYCVLCSTVWTKAGFVSMDAVTREVSRDQYQIAEASDTETPDFLTL